jgi:hypothetical protein
MSAETSPGELGYKLGYGGESRRLADCLYVIEELGELVVKTPYLSY